MKRIVTSFDEIPCQLLEAWLVRDGDTPSFWKPSEIEALESNRSQKPKKFGDIVLGGLEVSTDERGEINEFGFIVDLNYLKHNKRKTIKWPRVKCGRVLIKNIKWNEPNFYDESGMQEIYFDPCNRIIQWEFDQTECNSHILIAKNVIIGLHDKTLQSIIVKLK